MRFLALFAALSLHAQTADLLISNATIYTADSAVPKASYLAVKDGRILAIGDKFQGKAVRSIDAHGAMVMPGFIDSHGHVEALGDSLDVIDLRGVRSEAEAAAMVKKAAQSAKPGDWIRGRSWDQNLWLGKQFPTKVALDSAAPRNPVTLSRVDGHASWVNQRALDLADVNGSTPDPFGGKILRAPSGEATGVLIDVAQRLVAQKVPPPSAEQVRLHLARATQELARLGITSVHDAGVSQAALEGYRALIASNQMPVRINAMIGGVGPLWEQYKQRGPEIGDFLTVRSIKLYADGALGSRGAALLAPYSDDAGNTGLLINSEDLIRQVSIDAIRTGFQVCTHAIGDRGNRAVLSAYGAALGGANNKRFRIEHAQVVAPEDFDLFRKFNIIASVQATHATSDMGWAETRLGPERIRGAYAWQTFLKRGIAVTNGSDFPVEQPNPIWGFYSALTREDHAGAPKGGWYPEQRFTREEALQSWTASGAYAAFEEKTKGTLSPGKLADFVMLSADIMQVPEPEVWRAHVTMTVVGGRIVYQE